jgi:para-nitrobenzyl esterase
MTTPSTSADAGRSDPVPVIGTPEGFVQGRRLGNGVLCFSGIPFAGPASGSGRFRPPAPVRPWSGVFDATRFPPAPIQGPLGGATEVSEDCLALNVWTPSTEGRHPVVVWIYGGGFEIGSASPPFTDGANLAAHGVVVVAANYRGGVLGFAHLADLGGADWAQSTNLGHQDQVAALQWVRSRIGEFGGDAGNITVAGQSAGAYSIGTLLAMPSAAGLFDKAIMSSGSTTRTYSRAIADRMANDLLAGLDVTGAEDLRLVPWGRMVEVQSEIIDADIGRRNTPGGRAWGSVLDGAILPLDPQQSMLAGGAARIPLVVGATRDEVQIFEIFDPDTFTPPSEQDLLHEMQRCIGLHAEPLFSAYRHEFPGAGLARLRSRFLTDWIYRIPAQRCATAQRAAGGAAWHYLFSWPVPELGAIHGMDTRFVFDRLESPQATDPVATSVRDQMLEAWLAFATTGDPGWPQHDPQGEATTRDFGGPAPLTLEPPLETRALWASSLAATSG